MLNRIAIEAALPIAQRLDERKLRVLPAQNSPLMSLTMAVDHTLVDVGLAQNSDIVSVLQSRAGGDAHRVAKLAHPHPLIGSRPHHEMLRQPEIGTRIEGVSW